MMSGQLKAIQRILKQNANSNALAAQQKFVPGAEKVYGVYTPVLNDIIKQFKESGFELVEELWNAGALEEKILAGKILGKVAKRDPAKTFKLFDAFSSGISDWAVCDTLGMQSLKPLVKTHQKEIFQLATRYNRSKNPWQRRLSLVMVEWYTRDKTMHPAINRLVHTLENDDAYYVKKAVVWIRKNFEKGR